MERKQEDQRGGLFVYYDCFIFRNIYMQSLNNQFEPLFGIVAINRAKKNPHYYKLCISFFWDSRVKTLKLRRFF